MSTQERRVSARPMTMVEAQIHAAVLERPGITAAEIADAVEASPAYVEKAIRKLVADGWLERQDKATTFRVRRTIVVKERRKC